MSYWYVHTPFVLNGRRYSQRIGAGGREVFIPGQLTHVGGCQLPGMPGLGFDKTTSRRTLPSLFG